MCVILKLSIAAWIRVTGVWSTIQVRDSLHAQELKQAIHKATLLLETVADSNVASYMRSSCAVVCY